MHTDRDDDRHQMEDIGNLVRSSDEERIVLEDLCNPDSASVRLPMLDLHCGISWLHGTLLETCDLSSCATRS
jgi:hypothetical protein